MNVNLPKTVVTVFTILLLSFGVLLTSLDAQTGKKEKSDIVEQVFVDNIELPIRVFDGKNPVDGLKKEDFELFLNGKRKTVSGFYSLKKKLELVELPESGKTGIQTVAAQKPRMFVLIFNITDFKMQVDSLLNALFSRIIRPRDRVIVITNRYFFPEWTVSNPADTKNKIKEILAKEVKATRDEMMHYEMEVKAMGSLLVSQINDPFAMLNPSIVFEDFFINYSFLLEDIKEDYLTLPVESYVKIAEYLKGQDMDKWVLNFYELGRLPLLDGNGQILKKIESLYSLSPPRGDPPKFSAGATGESKSETKQAIQKLYFEYLRSIQNMDDILLNDINKSFLNSGATFHTLLLNPQFRYLSDEFSYRKITTQGEEILKSMARMTGGSILNSNKVDAFLKEVTVRQDIVYVLTYIPDKKHLDGKLEIKVKGKKYRIVFDNNRRHKAFRHIVRKMRKNKRNLEIDALELKNNAIAVRLKNIELVEYEEERYGAVKARVKILDNNKKVVAAFEKAYKGVKENGILMIPLPKLPDAKCKVVVEVKDLFALNSIYAGDAITVK